MLNGLEIIKLFFMMIMGKLFPVRGLYSISLNAKKRKKRFLKATENLAQ